MNISYWHEIIQFINLVVFKHTAIASSICEKIIQGWRMMGGKISLANNSIGAQKIFGQLWIRGQWHDALMVHQNWLFLFAPKGKKQVCITIMIVTHSASLAD